EDSGPGVAASMRQVIFEPFRQGDAATRRFGGTGLGLAIAKELLDLMGGRIEVRNAPDGGALFEFETPTVAPPGVDVGTIPNMRTSDPAYFNATFYETETTASSGIVGVKDRPLILIVEDNRDMSGFIEECLRDEFQVACAENGRLGLMKAEALQPDLIISDLMMPDMAGDQLLSELRRRPIFERTPVMLVTARADEEMRVRLLRSGAQDVLTKPFSARELVARAQNLIKARRAVEPRK
ncbi:MAG: response regulator, partial [Caulobacterales bacterium]